MSVEYCRTCGKTRMVDWLHRDCPPDPTAQVRPMTTPTTETGQQALSLDHGPKGPCADSPDCEHGRLYAAIEQEAVAAYVASLKSDPAAVERIDRMVDEAVAAALAEVERRVTALDLSKDTPARHKWVVGRTDVLAIIREVRDARP